MTGLPGVSGGGRSSVDGVGVNVNNRNEVNILNCLVFSLNIYNAFCQFGTHLPRKSKFNSKETSKNLKQRMSSASDEDCELLCEAFENPESTPVHQPRPSQQNILEADNKSEIIRKVIGELDSKDSAMLSNPYQLSKDRRETRC